MNIFRKRTSDEIKNDNFRFSFKEYVCIYKNKKDSYFLEDFLNGVIQKKYRYIKFRKNGDIDYNPKSKNGFFVEYNNTWLEIKEFLEKNKLEQGKSYYEFTGNFSGSLWEEFEKEGFYIRLMKEPNEMGHRHKISLVSNIPWSI